MGVILLLQSVTMFCYLDTELNERSVLKNYCVATIIFILEF